MAATTRAITPTHTGPFPSPSVDPATPTSIQSGTHPTVASSREKSPGLPKPMQSSLAPGGPPTTLSPKSPKAGLSPRYTPQPLTGAAAMADEQLAREEKAREEARQMSPNPAQNALNALLGETGMSKAKDAPQEAATTLSEPLQKVARSLTIPDQVTAENVQTSPVSMSSLGSIEATTAPTVTASEPATVGPIGVEAQPPAPQTTASPDPTTSNQHIVPPGHTPFGGSDGSSRAFTFPVPNPDSDPRAPTRQMSLPMPGYAQGFQKSASPKRHKCPYCTTYFTRHHNLKSHLLTHSQEKPYECPTCQARFRRLHDLKRHTKLHTGERPHTCPKCGRKFARGDALARHNKGQGGCAGRRSSFGVDDEGDMRGEDSMDGIIYQGEHGDDERMDEDDVPGSADRRRVSEPTSQAHGGRQGSIQGPFSQHGSTYPPVGVGNNLRPMFQPASGSSAPGQSQANISPKPGHTQQPPFNASQSGAVFPQSGMTESPTPLSPGKAEAAQQSNRMSISDASHARARSPSMTQQIHQQHYNRGAGRGSSPMGPLPPPGTSAPSQLPVNPALGPTDRRLPIPAKVGSQHAQGMLHQQVPPPPPATAAANTSNPGSLSSHGPSSAGSMREILGGREGGDIWNYVRDLEARLSRIQDDYEVRVSRLQDEVSSLKAQLHQQPQQGQQQRPPPPPPPPPPPSQAGR